MSLLKITAKLECDKCGQNFTADVPADAAHQPEGTAFDIVVENLDFTDDGTKVLKDAGFHDGEFFCPACWDPKCEELFIAEIKAGKYTRETLEKIAPELMEHLPNAT